MENDGIKVASDFFQQLSADLKKASALNGSTIGGGNITGQSAKNSMEPPLKKRLGKDTEEAMTQKTLTDIKKGNLIEDNDEEINKAIGRFIDQLFTGF